MGNCHQDKPKNTVAAFDRAQYKALAHHPSQRIPGRFPDQIKAVTKEPLHHKPFSEEDHFMVVGPKFGNKFIPQHLEGQLEVLGSVRVFQDDYGQKFHEILSDITAEVESLRHEIETPDTVIEENDNFKLKKEIDNLQEKISRKNYILELYGDILKYCIQQMGELIPKKELRPIIEYVGPMAKYILSLILMSN